MELRHLRYFVMAAAERNISRAAARLRISQPAVSRQLRDLEEELGATLFLRKKDGLQLTPAGDLFLNHARDLLRRSNEAVRQLRALRPDEPATFTVGYIAPVLAGTLTPALRRFAAQHHEQEVTLRELQPAAQIKALREGQLDVAVLGNPCAEIEQEFAVTVLKRVPFWVALPDNHWLALRKRITLTELKNEIFLGLQEDRFPGRKEILFKACQTAGFTPSIKCRAESLSALMALVASGKGVSLVPEEARLLPHPQTALIPLKPPVPHLVSAAVQRRDVQHPLTRDLLACCQPADAKTKRPQLRGTRKKKRLIASGGRD